MLLPIELNSSGDTIHEHLRPFSSPKEGGLHPGRCVSVYRPLLNVKLSFTATPAFASVTGTVTSAERNQCALYLAVGMKKNAAAVALGRRGGLARAKALTAAERRAIGRKAIRARWSRKPRSKK